MAKTSKDRDRRAVVEQLRREQQRKERRRTLVVLAVCVVIAVIIVGAAAVPLINASRDKAKPLADIGASRGAAGCRAISTKPANGNQDHKPEGTVIDYPDAPPAFGAHYPTPAPFSRKFYTSADRPKVSYLVHNLEHGYTVLWYDDTVAGNKTQLAAVKAIAAKFAGSSETTRTMKSKFIAAPWTSKDGKAFPAGTHVALTHWSAGKDATDTTKQKGVWQYCGKPSGAVVTTFMKAYPYTDSPEPQGV
jgi:hypothetical protein